LLIFTADKKKLQHHFEKDRVLFAYHLGDLDDFHFERCQWAAAYGRSPRIDDVVLIYTGLETPTVLAFGLSERFRSLLESLLDLLPERFHCHFQEKSRDIFRSRYREKPLGMHLKMKLGTFAPASDIDNVKVIRLDGSHEPGLRELYDVAYPDGYFDSRMLATGKYFGYLVDDRVLAVAGIHVYSDEYKVAVLGSITTHPDHRGRGLATALTSHLTAELVSEGKLVCLNVKADNLPAIHCYEKLGFETIYEYEEALFELK
jgi:ribosomal protein S18 acetylase RimI-like enzyme